MLDKLCATIFSQQRLLKRHFAKKSRSATLVALVKIRPHLTLERWVGLHQLNENQVDESIEAAE